MLWLTLVIVAVLNSRSKNSYRIGIKMPHLGGKLGCFEKYEQNEYIYICSFGCGYCDFLLRDNMIC